MRFLILLDENLKLVHDESEEPSETIREALIKCRVMCVYADTNTLYRFTDKGELFLYSLSKPKFHSAVLNRWDLEVFKRERRLATESLVVRDLGCEKSQIYMDNCSFAVPTELLVR